MTVKAFFLKIITGKHFPYAKICRKSFTRKNKQHFGHLEQWPPRWQWSWKNSKVILIFKSIALSGDLHQTFGWKKGAGYQDLAMDGYILGKVIFPLYIIINNLEHNNIILWIMIYLLAETVLYIPTLIFASDLFAKPRSYKRSMLMLFFNYSEIIFSFAVLYSSGNYLNLPFYHWYDPIYFSVVTSSTIGYGEYYPVAPLGKFMVSIQALLFIFFVILFLNFFTTKIKSHGYFDHKQNKRKKKSNKQNLQVPKKGESPSL